MRCLPVFLAVLACNPPVDADTDLPGTYTFAGRSGDSVSYSGQVFRHLLIADLTSHVGGLTGRIDGGWFPTGGEVEAELEFYLGFDSETSGTVPILFDTDPDPVQPTYDDVSSGKDLWGKLAGNDAVGQHADWSTAFAGWDADGVTTPQSLVEHWVAVIDDQAVDWGNGTYPLDPDANPVPEVYVTAQGQDLQQLLQKFLLGAVAFSQGTDDYLDDDIEGKGLLADHTDVEEGEPYTALEHAWDEGFGYFGAARDYRDWSDDTIADVGTADTFEPDGAIDLLSEVCWGHSVNAAKRDRGAVATTDLTADAWDGFLRGRHLIDQADGPLTTEELAELKGYRDQAVLAWEKAIAATIVHYVNETLQDMEAIDAGGYDFGSHAKHWSELKGFALALQFNPRSPVSDADFATIHGLLGTAPVLADATPTVRDEYAADLRTVRTILADAYGFDSANLGGDDGLGGW